MKSKKISDATIEELKAMRKTVKAITWVLATLILLYCIYFVTRLATGTWDTNNTLGIVGLGTLVIVSSVMSLQLGRIDKEMKGRSDKG